MDKKYAPLNQYLAYIGARTDDITLSFAQIEKIIKARLPMSAYEYGEWWSNERSDKDHPQKHAWLAANWRTDNLDLEAQQVRFRRGGK